MKMHRLIRQWLPLTALVFGLIACAIGEKLGHPNSIWFFIAGVAVAVLLAVRARLRSKRLVAR